METKETKGGAWLRGLVYLILVIMGLLIVVTLFGLRWGVADNAPVGTTFVIYSQPTGGMTSISSKDAAGERASTPQMLNVSAQAAQTIQAQVFATATAEKAVTQQIATATQQVVSAQQLVEAQMLQSLLTTNPTEAQAYEAQKAARAANEATATARVTEVAAAATYEAFIPTATVQAAMAATQQVKAFAMATATVKAAQAELAAVEAKVQAAEKSLKEMKAMGLDTGGALATLEALRDQAQLKVESLQSRQTTSQGMWPGGSGMTSGMTYVVQAGDTWYSIAQRFGLRAEELAAANGFPVVQGPYVGQTIIIPPTYLPQPQPIPAPNGMVYIVQPRDTLFSIARRFGVPLTELAAANRIVDYNHIWVGQQLLIPVTIPYPSYPPGAWTPSPPWYPTPMPGPWLPTPTIWPPPPTYWPWTPTPTPITGNDVYHSTDGRFSVQYPRAWLWGTDVPSGYVMFWSRTGSAPLMGFAIFSKPASVWRPAREVLESYKSDLGSRNLMNAVWGPVSYSWDGRVDPYTLGGQLGMGEFGYAQSNRLLAKATARNDGTREYLALAWAQSDQWDAQRAALDQLLNTLAFDN